MRKPLIALAVIGTMLGACAQPEVGSLDAPPVSGAVEVDGLSFPLPTGDWQLAASYNQPGASPNAPQAFRAYVSRSDKLIDRVAIVWVQRKSTFKNLWRKYQSCLTEGDPGVHHAVVTTNTGDFDNPSTDTAIDCWHVRTFSLGTQGGAHPIVEGLRAYADSNGLFLSPAMVGARFAQKRQADRRSYVEYLWTPDILVPRFDNGIWGLDDWSPEAVAADPARTIAVKGLVDWATTWRPRILGSGAAS